MTAQVRLDVDQVLIGRRDPSQGHYPDLDLGHFRQIDAHISRRHARVYRKGSRWFLEDLCENDATYLNDKAHVLNGESVPLKNGDEVLISDSVAMTFRVQG
jgi:pSer/pThr/pTyr-binding forkhead associated (FHA) protein